MRQGDLEGAHAALTAHAQRLLTVDVRRAATLLLLASKLRVLRLEARRATEEVEQALQLLPAEHELVDLVALSMSQGIAGAPGARTTARDAVARAARATHGHAHTLGFAWPLVWCEDHDLAREVTSRSIALRSGRPGFLLYRPHSLLPRAELDFRTGHLICSNCGDVADFALTARIESSLEAALRPAARSANFAVDGHRLDLVGQCADCR